jgi:hypothetical protein
VYVFKLFNLFVNFVLHCFFIPTSNELFLDFQLSRAEDCNGGTVSYWFVPRSSGGAMGRH